MNHDTSTNMPFPDDQKNIVPTSWRRQVVDADEMTTAVVSRECPVGTYCADDNYRRSCGTHNHFLSTKIVIRQEIYRRHVVGIITLINYLINNPVNEVKWPLIYTDDMSPVIEGYQEKKN